MCLLFRFLFNCKERTPPRTRTFYDLDDFKLVHTDKDFEPTAIAYLGHLCLILKVVDRYDFFNHC